MTTMKHTLVALVEDKPGVLNRMVSLFRRRGFNIDSIVVGHSEVPHLSRVTIVINGSVAMVEPEENVFPMVPPGAAVAEFIEEPKKEVSTWPRRGTP